MSALCSAEQREWSDEATLSIVRLSRFFSSIWPHAGRRLGARLIEEHVPVLVVPREVVVRLVQTALLVEAHARVQSLAHRDDELAVRVLAVGANRTVESAPRVLRPVGPLVHHLQPLPDGAVTRKKHRLVLHAHVEEHRGGVHRDAPNVLVPLRSIDPRLVPNSGWRQLLPPSSPSPIHPSIRAYPLGPTKL
jgi:hypothetical protein